MLIGSPITLGELKQLGEFIRWQDIDSRLAPIIKKKLLPNGYPIIESRLKSNGLIDLNINGQWQQVKFKRREGSPMSGDQRIVYLEGRKEKSIPYSWYGVAPVGYYTQWNGQRPGTLDSAKLLDNFKLTQQDHVIHEQVLKKEDWPYLGFEVRSFNPNARWVELDDMWVGSHTVHVADPRVHVEGVDSHEPWFNTTISVSHRWLHPEHPDPDGIQFAELMELAKKIGLHDNQTFLVDYCSLPQKPRTDSETAWFNENLPGFQKQFKHITLVLNTGSDDYSTRAWCMLELMLSAMSRTKLPTILNHDKLDKPLMGAKELAAEYVKQANWSLQQMSTEFRHGLTNASFAKWSRDPMNVALYNASLEGKRNILKKFETELAVTDINDKAIILDLLEQIAFKGEEI